MKRFLFFALILTLIIMILPSFTRSKDTNSVTMDYQVIPDDAIRLRILANSDNDEDQRIKRVVRDHVNESISKWVKDIADIEEARRVIKEQMPVIRKIVAKTLKQEGAPAVYTAEYGKKVTFPAKLYGSYLYPPGEYEAVLITLGSGKGANWWCVLFPPLCFLDFSNGTTIAEAAPDDDKQQQTVDKVVDHHTDKNMESKRNADDTLKVASNQKIIGSKQDKNNHVDESNQHKKTKHRKMNDSKKKHDKKKHDKREHKKKHDKKHNNNNNKKDKGKKVHIKFFFLKWFDWL